MSLFPNGHNVGTADALDTIEKNKIKAKIIFLILTPPLPIRVFFP